MEPNKVDDQGYALNGIVDIEGALNEPIKFEGNTIESVEKSQ